MLYDLRNHRVPVDHLCRLEERKHLRDLLDQMDP
jgi:hypothetical protein